MNRLVLNSNLTDEIKFTRTIDFDAENPTDIGIIFLDQVWKVEIRSQRTPYWTFQIKIGLKSCRSGRKLVSVTGWINDLLETETDDDWTDPIIRPHFKRMKKLYDVSDDLPDDPIFVSPSQVGPRAQLRIIFEIFDENLRSSVLTEENKVIEKLFTSKMYFDVTLEANDGKVRAHKWILKMKSKYFEAMFDNELGGQNQDHFKIADISYVVLNEIMRFIYTERVEDMEALAHEILQWSDFFVIDDLRDLSADYVIKSFNPENVLNVMELAVNTNQSHLKEQCTKYFKRNMEMVISSKAWLSTYKNLPSSVQEMIKLLISK